MNKFKTIYFSTFFLLTCALSLNSQDSNFDKLLSVTSEINNNEVSVYKLFPTENMWTFLKLDTRNGKIWQVQFDVQGEQRFQSDLNFIELVLKSEEKIGRFTLYPTQNMYNFLLLDQIRGDVWQVQWSTEKEYRAVVPIY